MTMFFFSFLGEAKDSIDHPSIITFYKHYYHSHAIMELWEEKKQKKINMECYAMNQSFQGVIHNSLHLIFLHNNN